MIELQRSMDHRWIIDKNVNSKDILQDFAEIAKDCSRGFSFTDIVRKASARGSYQGRKSGEDGARITVGVRILQACYYMFGYTFNVDNDANKKVFMPSPMTLDLLSTDDEIEKAKNVLVNLFCLQFPHPFSWTPNSFELYYGRLIVKLLLDERINKKLYIDECIWFLPFIEKVTPASYKQLVDSILEYRTLSYEEKKKLFRSVDNYQNLFANVCHEVNYYFLRLFSNFGVFNLKEDRAHNGGQLFSFLHCRPSTYRNDAYQSRKNHSGYVTLSSAVEESAKKLIDRFSVFDKPTKMDNDEILSKRDWLTRLYEIEPLEYLNTIETKTSNRSEVIKVVNEMIRASKYGSRDGKEFENALKPFMELFRETSNVEIISGSGNTDLLCSMEDAHSKRHYKMNVDAKTRKSALEEINSRRITKHLIKHAAKFCVIIAPKFARGVNDDIGGYQIVTIKSDDLGAYCTKECMNSRDGYADFEAIQDIITQNMGKDISEQVRKLTEERYGLTVV